MIVETSSQRFAEAMIGRLERAAARSGVGEGWAARGGSDPRENRVAEYKSVGTWPVTKWLLLVIRWPPLTVVLAGPVARLYRPRAKSEREREGVGEQE